ncbi:uxt prefoldin-like subunit [Brevipalpus obovatus]|uniref:uxt prefoldin-like subunit n=1 Tax=Brevipalpus obovatus TaxID=246614 RepID=UPI003D9DE62A
MVLPTIPESTSISCVTKPSPQTSSSPSDLPLDPLIYKFESFINDRLREDLRIINKRQEAIHVQVHSYNELKSFILEVKSDSFGAGKSIKTQIDMGCNFYMRCTIPQTDKIIVFIGLGLYMEFSLQEALIFIEKRCKYLDQCLEKLSEQACSIKAHIKVMLNTLGYIQGIGPDG